MQIKSYELVDISAVCLIGRVTDVESSFSADFCYKGAAADEQFYSASRNGMRNETNVTIVCVWLCCYTKFRRQFYSANKQRLDVSEGIWNT
jgi:hypothetical protein